MHNFISYLVDFYDGFEVQANFLQPFYPKHVQKSIAKKKSQNSERIVASMKLPTFF